VVVEITSSGQVLARFGHALADPTRARVLLALREAPRYPADLADLAGVSRQAMSNHLACLRGCGLVVAVPEGRRSRYELADQRLAHALGDLLGVVLAVDPAVCATIQPEVPPDAPSGWAASSGSAAAFSSAATSSPAPSSASAAPWPDGAAARPAAQAGG
jgi:DNA-binding transcriptional ArsR family regulator